MQELYPIPPREKEVVKKIQQPTTYGDAAWEVGTLSQQPVYWNDDCCSPPPKEVNKWKKVPEVGYGDSAGIHTGTLA